MKVSIVAPDKTVVVDGIGYKVPADRWPTTADNIWAYQWDGSKGELETSVAGELNTSFTDIAIIQPYIDVHTALATEEAAAAAAEAEANEQLEEANLVAQAQYLAEQDALMALLE